MPLDTVRDQLYFTEGAFAYAGHHLHARVQPLHTHSFVEIAFVIGGSGVHQSLAGPQPLRLGDVILLRPGVWHGYDDCANLELYNCCFSGELLQSSRELMWTREDPLLGYLLWTGPYSGRGYGMLNLRLDPPTLKECCTHLAALDWLWHHPPEPTGVTSSGGWRCCSACSAGRWPGPASICWPPRPGPRTARSARPCACWKRRPSAIGR